MEQAELLPPGTKLQLKQNPDLLFSIKTYNQDCSEVYLLDITKQEEVSMETCHIETYFIPVEESTALNEHKPFINDDWYYRSLIQRLDKKPIIKETRTFEDYINDLARCNHLWVEYGSETLCTQCKSSYGIDANGNYITKSNNEELFMYWVQSLPDTVEDTTNNFILTSEVKEDIIEQPSNIVSLRRR